MGSSAALEGVLSKEIRRILLNQRPRRRPYVHTVYMVYGSYVSIVRNWCSVSYVSMIGSDGLFRVIIHSMNIPSGVTCTVWFYKMALHFGWTAHLGF